MARVLTGVKEYSLWLGTIALELGLLLGLETSRTVSGLRPSDLEPVMTEPYKRRKKSNHYSPLSSFKLSINVNITSIFNGCPGVLNLGAHPTLHNISGVT